MHENYTKTTDESTCYIHATSCKTTRHKTFIDIDIFIDIDNYMLVRCVRRNVKIRGQHGNLIVIVR